MTSAALIGAASAAPDAAAVDEGGGVFGGVVDGAAVAGAGAGGGGGAADANANANDAASAQAAVKSVVIGERTGCGTGGSYRKSCAASRTNYLCVGR